MSIFILGRGNLIFIITEKGIFIDMRFAIFLDIEANYDS